ncbi:hypothetical protein [Histidinibacterium aquaticum]|uniref:Uncharacterized protein n=1 Tax=Histidinibacterium aquaticum TaxID=2613962 RepID=A0A5J5GSP5_9RHOB|nr:hypothetical protein [Histidinibacterium aquaticum]KAA9010554.1 hypothetical protein F3S47_04755 [Histidinibacterium aquaticum]
MRRLACLVASLPFTASPALAQSERTAAILAEAERQCQEIDAGGLTVEPGAITQADLDGDGAADDEVVNFAGIFCQWNMSHWHGTGGAPIHFVIDGQRSESWWANSWARVQFDDMPVILLSRHGSLCDNYGASPCVQAIVPTENGFQVVEDTRSEEATLRGASE